MKYVVGRGPWVRWDDWGCNTSPDQPKVANVDTGAVTEVPEWARAVGDGFLLGWNSAELTAVDLLAEGLPRTVLGTTSYPYLAYYQWGVDETAGRLVTFVDEFDLSVVVRRLPGTPSAPALLRSAPGAPVGGVWKPAFDYSGNGVDWTLTIAQGTAQQTVLSGTATDGVVRPVWNISLPGATYPFRLSVTPRDGTAAPADVTGTVAVPRATSLSLPTPASVTYGTPVTIAATLTAAGAPVAGQPVRFEVRRAGTSAWSPLAVKNTTSTGKTTAFAHTPSYNVEYRATFAGTASLLASSLTRSVGVGSKVSAATSIVRALNGTQIRISGSVSPAHSGTMLLQAWTGSKWATVATTTLSGSAYAFTPRPMNTGVYRYRVVRPADADHVSGISPTVTYTAYRVKLGGVSHDVEYASLHNSGTTAVNLSGWVLDAGSSTERFRLPSYTLAPGATVHVRTGYGTNRTGVIYLNRSGGIWLPHDTGSLYDPRGVLSSRLRY